MDGIFCCLFCKGSSSSLTLGNFDVARGYWSMIMDPSASRRVCSQNSSRNFLVEFAGKILVAVDNEAGGCYGFWNIYRFDWSRKDWTRVENLGNKTLFLRRASCKSSCGGS